MHTYLARHSASCSPMLPRILQMVFAIGLLSCLIVSVPNAVVGTAGAATAAPRAAAKDAHQIAGPAHAYLMRGLMNVFSLGMDQLAVLIARHGIEASVHNHAEADAVVSEIAARYSVGDRGPIILIGHSLGADAAMTMAQSLARVGIPVALVVPFDGTDSFAASKNVACVLNITQRTYAYMRSGDGFHGELTNVNVSGEPGIDHFTIDKSPKLQSLVMKSVLEAASAQSCRPGVDAPVLHAAAPLRRRGTEGLTY
jgi:Thioesterase domain